MSKNQSEKSAEVSCSKDLLEITIKLSRPQFSLVHTVAQISELQDCEFVLSCIRSRLECAVEQAVQDLLPIPIDELDNLIAGISDN